MKSWSKPPVNNGGQPITKTGPGGSVSVVGQASTRSSSKLATHTQRPTNPGK